MAQLSMSQRPTLSTSNSGRPRTTDAIKPLRPKRPETSRNVSFNTTPINDGASYPSLEPLVWEKQAKCQRLNRLAQNVDPNIAPTCPSLARPTVTPFVAYDDSFATLLGATPSIKLLIRDPRAPFFYSGGAWLPLSRTLFLTSSLLRDLDPSAVSSAGKRTEISKIEFHLRQDLSRDKVRTQDHNYLAAGCAPYPSPMSTGIVLCAQGTLKDPAGLIYVDAKRPHKSHMLLNNFQGRPFNSPCDIAANMVDNCLYFTDPAYGYERGYRPKPQLPTGHIYRYDPSSGDCRVIADGISRPGGLAFSPDHTVLYVSDLGDRYGGITIHAFDVIFTTPASNQPRPLARSISTTSGARSGTPNSHQKHSSSSSTESNDSAHPHYKTSPIASSRGLAAAARLASSTSQSSATSAHSIPSLSRSNSRDRARRVLDIAQNQSRQLRSMGSSFGMNLKSSFNTTPSLSTTLLQRPPVQPPILSPPPPPPPPSSLAAASDNQEGSRTGAFLINKRLFAYSASTVPSGGLSTDPVQGNVWLGTDEGVEIFSGNMGSMVGKILVPEDEDSSPADKRREGRKMTGVSRVAFGGEGEAWLLGGERLWRVAFGRAEGSVLDVM